MAAPLSTAVLVRLCQSYARANPTWSDERIVAKARSLITSLRSVGLDIVFSEWVDNPEIARANPDKSWDPFIEGMRTVYDQNRERAPWNP